MNERIRKLAEQAGIFKPKEFYQHIDALQLEKFAELIIKRCMDVAKYHSPDTEECDYTWLIHDKIKKHFGVEE